MPKFQVSSFSIELKTTRTIILCLLFALPLALRGQANLPKHQGGTWQDVFMQGGLLRHDDYFIRIEERSGDLVSMDFVNGFSIGPKATFGKILKDYSRIEIDEEIRWACSRERLMAKGALRYVFAPQFNGFAEIFGGKYTNDFDRYPVLDESARTVATGLFGWNHVKLYEQTTFGTRLYGALDANFQINALIAWEKRKQLDIYRKTSVFGKHVTDNIPYVHGEPIENFDIDKIFRMDVQLDYSPGRKIIVLDDMNAFAQTENPVYSLRQTSGFNGGLRFLSFELSMIGRRQAWKKYQQFQYYASAGFFPVRKKVLLMDMRHTDASSFALQRRFAFTTFSLLDNYELSTSKSWIEGHAELNNGFLYGQLHAIKVADRQAHEELSFGISLMGALRVGASVGFDDAKYDGVAFNLSVNL